MKPGDAHLIFNGQSGLLKMFLYGDAAPRHVWQARDVGVGDAYVTASEDEYGHNCKCPPGKNYTLGAPQPCGPNSDDGIAYGWWFIPINDDSAGDMSRHGRAGIGIHGGGSASPDPFGENQGFYDTLGCIRMLNHDIGMEQPAPGTLVNSVVYIQKNDGTIYLDVCWP